MMRAHEDRAYGDTPRCTFFVLYRVVQSSVPKMAAHLKGALIKWSRLAVCQNNLTYCVLRWMSAKRYPWSPDSLPSGDTFKAIREARRQNPVIKGRKSFDWWKVPLIEMSESRYTASRPNLKPAKLHMVIRIKILKGRPKWEKKTMEDLGLAEKLYNPVIVKNTEYMNSKLKSVKHLIKVQPVTFPYGPPQSEEDLENCVLKDNGEFVIQRKISPSSVGDVKMEKKEKNVWEMDSVTLRKHMEKTKLTYKFMSEYFPTQYHYKHNQDGKEHRYRQTDNIADDVTWF